MDRTEGSARDDRPRPARELEETSAPRPADAPDDGPGKPASDDPVTAYDHLWFDRRPLS